MAGSALVGHPPNTKDDMYIIKGFFRSKGLPDSAFHGMSSTIPIKAPPNAPHDSRASEVIAEMSVVIALVFIITVTTYEEFNTFAAVSHPPAALPASCFV